MTSSIALTRRSLLRMGAAAGASTLVGLRPWAPARAAAAAGHLRRSSWEGLAGRQFAAGPVELRLVSVGDVAGAAVDRSLAGSEDAFVLTFAGPLEPVLEAGTHTLGNPELGTFELFASPVERPREEQRYEAVVDRSVGAPESPPKRAAAAGQSAAEPSAGVADDAPRRARLLRRVSLRRTARGARAEIVLRRSASAARIEARLVRRGRTIATTARDVRGRRAVLRFRGVADLPGGDYSLLLTIVDDAGLVTTRRRRFELL